MRYIQSDRIEKDTKEIQDLEIFTLITPEDQKTRGHIKKQMCSFAMKVKGEMTVSSPFPIDAKPEEVKKAWSQINYAKKNGWAETSERGMSEYGEMGRIYRCLYCGAESVGVEAPCECRGKPKPKGLEDFIFPNW